MTTQEKTLQLKNIIINELADKIGSKVILLDCPYHGNVGDILIWEGECEFFKITNKKILSQHSLFTYNFPDIPEDVTICLHGGGNFGDLYRAAQDFRIDVINRYPRNKIIIFPQSVFYENKELIEKDINEFSKHHNLIMCARDRNSFFFLQTHFEKCNIMLVPDMAFCIDISKFGDFKNSNSGESVYFKRIDKEFSEKQNDYIDSLKKRDWAPFERKHHWSFILMRIGYWSMKIRNRYIKDSISRTLDFIMQKFAKYKLIKSGINTLRPFQNIYTTRLHAMILGVLMDKKVYGIDGKTNKVRSYYGTWLNDCDKVEMFNWMTSEESE